MTGRAKGGADSKDSDFVFAAVDVGRRTGGHTGEGAKRIRKTQIRC